MNEFKITAGRSGKDSRVEINGKPVLATDVALNINVHKVTTLTVEMIITQPTEIVGEGLIKINALPIEDRIGRLVYQSLKERYEPAGLDPGDLDTGTSKGADIKGAEVSI